MREPHSRPPASTSLRVIPVALALVLASGGCGIDSAATTPGMNTAWNAEFFSFGTGDEGDLPFFNANAGIISGLGSTQIGLGLFDAEPGLQFGWRVVIGDCIEPGAPVSTSPGAFPNLTIDPGGEAVVLVTFGGVLREEDPYAVEVYWLHEEESQLTACGDLIRQN